jgi:malonyl CoA-acyl carrier protein transacylase
MTTKLTTIMDAIGRDAKKALSEVVKYLPAAATLASIIFPGQAGTVTGVVNAVNLVQSAVSTVEQKMAAAGIATGTGAQKLADVLTIVTPVVTQELTAAGLTPNTAYITSIVNAVVAVLNVQTVPATA